MLIKNAKLQGQEKTADIAIRNGVFSEIADTILPVENETIIDARNGLVLPPYVDSHCHLDYVGTSGRPKHNVSGTLFEGISILEQIAGSFTIDDIKARALKVIQWQLAHGTQFIRTHVNTDEEGLVSLKALLSLREELRPWADIQIVAFPQHGIYKYHHALDLLEEALKLGADAIGAIPHCEDTREEAVLSLQKIFDLAAKYDRMVDVHCDETDDEQSRSLEVVCKEAILHGLGSKVTASHTTAMGSYNNAYTFKLFSLIKRSGINIVSNPTINIHLQGRYDTYPKRRGITRVKELLENGINVSMGTDDIMDPCYPLGTGSMLEVLQMGVHVCQLTGYEQLLHSIDLITSNGARTLNIQEQYGIEPGKRGNLIILPACDEYDALRRMTDPVYSIRDGRLLMQRTPSVSMLYKNNAAEEITFSM